MASRVFGFVRTLVLTSVLGITFLGNTYAIANGVPNVVFEIVAGGAVAAFLLPALAFPVAAGDKRATEQIASSVLNTGLLALTPLVAAGFFLREPLMRMLTGAVADPALRAAQQRVGALLLLMFLPQIWIYTVGVVLTAVLHAHQRFVAPAVAPLVSSLTVTAAYLLYRSVEGGGAQDLEVSTAGLLILGLGTTSGVAALAAAQVPAVRRLGFRWRPVVRIPPEARSKLRTLAAPAITTVGGQQLLTAVVLVIANRVSGGVVAYQLAFSVLLLFWAVLPLPVATTTFPDLASAASRGDMAGFALRSSEAIRLVIVLVFGSAAVMAASAEPAAGAVLGLGAGGPARSQAMVAWTLAAFAPGLVGYGIYALLSRAAFALGDGRSPGEAAALAFGLGIALDLLAAATVEGRLLIPALAAAFSVGMLAGAAWLLVRFRRVAGADALSGARPAASKAAAAALLAAAAGVTLAGAVPRGNAALEAAAALASASLVLIVYLGCLRAMGDRVIAAAAALLRRSS